jgi:ABC-type sugar transport system permease subunit
VNPALLLVVLLAGTAMLLLGVLSAVFDWLPLMPAIVLAGVGAIVPGDVLAAAIDGVGTLRCRAVPAVPARSAVA